MVAVYHGFAIGDVGYAVNQGVAGFGVIGFEHHAYFHFHWENVERLDAHQFRVLLAECVVGRKSYIHFFAHGFAVQRFLHQRENAVVAAVQIGDGLFCFVDQLVVGIKHFIMQGYYGVFFDVHGKSFLLGNGWESTILPHWQV